MRRIVGVKVTKSGDASKQKRSRLSFEDAHAHLAKDGSQFAAVDDADEAPESPRLHKSGRDKIGRHLVRLHA